MLDTFDTIIAKAERQQKSFVLWNSRGYNLGL